MTPTSKRQRQIAHDIGRLIRREATAQEIAEERGVSPQTVNGWKRKIQAGEIPGLPPGPRKPRLGSGPGSHFLLIEIDSRTAVGLERERHENEDGIEETASRLLGELVHT